ncbi:MAG: hypothetical protein V1846_00525 [Candidatus Komeilibacteria bacterium]
MKKRLGASILIAALMVTAIALSIVLSMVVLALDNHAGVKSFLASLQSFNSVESNLQESLNQLRLDPGNSTFTAITVGGVPASTKQTASQTSCLDDPQCQYTPGSGWWGEYFNYSRYDPDMEDNAVWGSTPLPTQHYWYNEAYKKMERIDANLAFGNNWFPFSGTAWENKEGLAHDYHYGAHWRAKVTALTSAPYDYILSSDDDSWVLVNGIVVVNNSGVHASFTKTGQIYLSQGANIVEVYFAERHTSEAGLDFHFTDATLVITPWPEGCADQSGCRSVIEATATSTNAVRKAEYNCDQLLSNCQWLELTP